MGLENSFDQLLEANNIIRVRLPWKTDLSGQLMKI